MYFWLCRRYAVFVFQVTGESSIVLFMLLVLLSLLIFGGELWFIMQNIRTLNKGGCALLLTYVLAVLAVTLLWRKGGTDSRLQMQLFTGVGEALQNTVYSLYGICCRM